MRVLIMCPKCGLIRGKGKGEKSKFDICEFCNTPRIELLDVEFPDFIKMNSEERHLFDQRIHRQHLFNLDTFDEETYEARLKEDQEFKKSFDEESAKIRYELHHPKCPRCGSEAITAGARGWGLMTGFIGSGSTVNRCSACGHKWKP